MQQVRSKDTARRVDLTAYVLLFASYVLLNHTHAYFLLRTFYFLLPTSSQATLMQPEVRIQQ